jgi:hypothetical protein
MEVLNKIDVTKREINLTFTAFRNRRSKDRCSMCNKINQSQKAVKFSLKNFVNCFK